MPSHNLAISITKWYDLHEDMKICKNCEGEEIENEVLLIFSCDKYDNIRKKAPNNIREVNNIKLQITNKIEKNQFLLVFDKIL